MATTGDGSSSIQRLPDDLLSQIYGAITSPLCRVRFAAVCRPWRAVASWTPPPPPLPLLLLSTCDRATTKDLYAPEDGSGLRLRLRLQPTTTARHPVQPRARRRWIVGSHDGGWVAAASAGPVLQILNLFSGGEVVLPAEQRRIDTRDYSTDPSRISKIIFSEEPTSPGCILAAITHGCTVALCRISNGCAHGDDKVVGAGWTMEGRGLPELDDIAFCNGELYGLDLDRFDGVVRLLKFGIAGVEDGGVIITSIDAVAIQSLHLLLEEHEDNVFVEAAYIFPMRGEKPAMAVDTGGFVFRVFELVRNESPATMPAAAAYDYGYRWAEMTSLGDYALFLSPRCSRAVEVSPAGGSGRGGVRRNRIYYANHKFGHLPFHSRHLTKMADGRDVYYDEDEIVCRGGKVIISRGFFGQRRVRPAMWLVPPRV
ncbi:uncharacterized protein LOC104583931 [Brachypodium distachyon]|uniref:uncharacterized protein LOC104583931 n=1 Tax=Brachypodium distachyon TaxID=15368 RepID=UPI00053005A4|nr:uncharacterized protein LOC104583931 [Brachypodium distachyon]|eukprot:XP_010236266.1 uncharacterized protein LOC104583931 [Brachypodium distachyon]